MWQPAQTLGDAPAALDGVEGIAPEPMGDFTLRELQDAVEGKVAVWGGVPASILCDGFPSAYVEGCVREILQAVAPGDRLVLGIGDMLPANGDIEKVRMISDIVDRCGRYPDLCIQDARPGPIGR